MIALALLLGQDVHIVPGGRTKTEAPSFELKGNRPGDPLSLVRSRVEEMKRDGWRSGPYMACSGEGSQLVTNDTFECLAERGSRTAPSGLYFMHFEFVANRLAAIIYSFPHDDFLLVRQALVEKYGAPAKSERRTWQNRFGARFDGEVVRWSKADAYLRLSEYSDRVDDSMITMADVKLLRQFEAKAPRGKPEI